MNKQILLKQKGMRGITLIALVITIIVLLILAGVSIATLTGENGILTQAENAEKETKIKTLEEKVKLEVLASYDTTGKINLEKLAENLGKVEGLTYNGEEVDKDTNPIVSLPVKVTVEGTEFEIRETGSVSEIKPMPLVTEAPTTALVKENTQYQDAGSDNKIAVIPQGFAVVPGCETINDGLVISDVANDEEDKGNQFVWIPVDKATFDTKFKRTGGYDFGESSDILGIGEADATGTNSEIEESETTQAEAIEMYASVKSNGGFYIGRYEAGNEGGTYNEEDGIWEGESKVVSKKGANVYNYIKWGESEIDGANGAVEKARNFVKTTYIDKGKEVGVTSTLIYGVQWDAALNFIDPNYITNEDEEGNPTCTSDSYLVNGTGWYEDNYEEGNPEHKTGIDLSDRSNSPKNIYDMGGNAEEWTMEYYFGESYSLHCRVCRGGAFQWDGFTYSPSHRGSTIYWGDDDTMGFRIAMYID